MARSRELSKVLSSSTALATDTEVASNSLFAGKNKIINGDFSIWQRGTSSTSSGYVTADRWYHFINSGSGTFAQESTTVPTGFRYCSKFTASATAQATFYQTIETANCINLAGQNVTLSAYVSASTSTAMSLGVEYSTTVDNSSTGVYTTASASSGGSGTAVSGSFVRISGVYAIPSTAKTIRVSVFTSSTIANATVVYVGGVQLEAGSTVTSFVPAGGGLIGAELALCQRYYIKFNESVGFVGGAGGNSNSSTLGRTFPVVMRAAPTMSHQNTRTTDYYTAGGTNSALTSWQIQPHCAFVVATHGNLYGGGRQVVYLESSGGTSYVEYAIEL